MMQGSGPADRDCDGYFPPIGNAFLARHIATFAFDKPGCGRSTGEWRDYGLGARADQAGAALELVRQHPAIDGARVGVWGQSQGGWLAQMLAGRDRDLPFAVANSGPVINVPQQDLYSREHTMRASGRTEAEIEQALAFVGRLHHAARSETDYAVVDAEILRQARSEPWYGSPSIDGAEDWRTVRMMIGEGYEPLDALAGVQCPFLAIYGGLDLLLPPWQSAEQCGRALHQAGTTDATIVVFPDGDHRIRSTTTGDFVPGYLDLLCDWVAGRARPTKV
jgi:pimeloyl-ACP methyl ester carboxylesterase